MLKANVGKAQQPQEIPNRKNKTPIIGILKEVVPGPGNIQ
jgi:hypothetical protein